MKKNSVQFADEKLINQIARRQVCDVSKSLHLAADRRIEAIMPKVEKVLTAFASEGLGVQHFASLTGSGLGDQGRELIDKVFAKILDSQKAAVRLQFVSGTHAIAASLFGVLRPGDRFLSITGRPYDTLEEVIGLRGNGQGSLLDFGINYDEISLFKDGNLDFTLLESALQKNTKLVFIQRSCGYSWRPSLTINQISQLCRRIHSIRPKVICFVDNCYGEFVEDREPTSVGADLMAGSLIKNLGGTIVPTGGYIAGRSELVEQACCRLTSPGIGSQAGINFDLNRLILQGIFLAPQMVSEALIGADIVCGVFSELGFEVQPKLEENRGDIIQAICLRDPAYLKVICKSFQEVSPVGSYLEPIPADISGYSSKLVMAGGTFIDGSTSELSADAPLRSPFNIYVQGGTHRSHVKIALIKTLVNLFKAGLLNLNQNKDRFIGPA